MQRNTPTHDAVHSGQSRANSGAEEERAAQYLVRAMVFFELTARSSAQCISLYLPAFAAHSISVSALFPYTSGCPDIAPDRQTHGTPTPAVAERESESARESNLLPKQKNN